MKVTKFWLGSMEQSSSSSISPHVLDLVQQRVALNTMGSVYRVNPEYEFELSGSPIEKAIRSWAILDL